MPEFISRNGNWVNKPPVKEESVTISLSKVAVNIVPEVELTKPVVKPTVVKPSVMKQQVSRVNQSKKGKK